MSEAQQVTLEELRRKIREESRFVDIKPFSHNLVGMYLLQIAKAFGNAEANKAIDDFKLERKGWKKVQGDQHP